MGSTAEEFLVASEEKAFDVDHRRIINNNIENPIRYQIIEAETQRENQENKKDSGFTKFEAYQLGEWRKPKDSKGQYIQNKFHQFFEFPWTPQMNPLSFASHSGIVL